MSRALAVLLASAAVALAPAASAATHTSSHKPHKGAHAETASKGRKTHAAKATVTARHHRGASQDEARAAPSRRSRHHGKAVSDEEAADAAPHGKHAKRRGKGAPAIETSAPSKRHGRSIVEEADASISARGSRGRSEEGERSERGLVIRADLRTTKACVAAHVRAHGRPKGSRARAALQRECAKEVEAARRRAEEEAAIRTWMPPHGPLIYQGALPQNASQTGALPPTGSQPGASAVSEPPPGAGPASSTAADTPPVTAAGDGPKDAPAASATVQQPPQPAQTGFFAGLFGKKRPARPTTGPAPTLAALVGADESRLKAELGEPELMRTEGDGALWTYRLPGCTLLVFLSRDTAATARGWKVKGAAAGPLKRGGAAPEVDVCLKSARS
jgi:hypothetical protein